MASTAPTIPHFETPVTAKIEGMRPHYSAEEKEAVKKEIKQLLKEQDAVLVAHYYVDQELQELAEETGGYISDSLDMAKFGKEHPAKTLIVAGVRFMASPAMPRHTPLIVILNPEKRRDYNILSLNPVILNPPST